MADTLQRLLVELSPTRLEVEPGASPGEATITLQNLGNVVEQYSADVVGLDAEWFTAPVASVSLFPQDRDQLRVSFHPPKRTGIKSGTYPFRVVVRARSGAQEETVEGVLEVRGFAVYRLDLVPRRQTARTGRFRLQVANTGTADVVLALEAHDQEDACRFKLANSDTPQVRAGATADLPVVVTPKKRPWVGVDQTYEFSIAARPADSHVDGPAATPSAGSAPASWGSSNVQTTAGQFTYHPYLRTWGPIRLAALILGGLVVVLLAWEIAVASGAWGGVADEFPQRMDVAGAQVHGFLCRAPGIGHFCAPETIGAVPVANPGGCEFKYGFLQAWQGQADLVGVCTTDAAYDSFGNGVQYSTVGVMWWLKASNTVYLFRGDSVYVFVEGKPRLLDGSGR
jgi:hypothetical protein